jgi:hypothetical protein
MSQRGRPKKNGVKPFWEFSRTVLGLYGYDKARGMGEKYEASLKAGIAQVKRAYPELPMSVTEMKRILATFRPKSGDAATFHVAECENFRLPGGRMTGQAWDIRIGAQPKYPRSNSIGASR